MNQPRNSSSNSEQKTDEAIPIRRSRIIFIAVILLTALAIIWPGQAIFSSPTPFIFGFPMSFAWIILWVLIGFAAMLGLYLSDSHDDHVSGEKS